MKELPARGYTIIELMVVMLVLSVLAMAVVPLSELTVQRDKERELKRALWEIRDAIDAYKRAHDAAGAGVEGASGYPPTLSALVSGRVDGEAAAGGAPRYFLRRVPRDPFADPTLPAEQTWGLRSYQSSPEQPAPGPDVYDVYSKSPLIGLNGVPLREW